MMTKAGIKIMLRFRADGTNAMEHIFIIRKDAAIAVGRTLGLRWRLKPVRPVFKLSAFAVIKPGDGRRDGNGPVMKQGGISHGRQHPARHLPVLRAAKERQILVRGQAGGGQVQICHHGDRANDFGIKGLLRGGDKFGVMKERFRPGKHNLAAQRPEVAEPPPGGFPRILVHGGKRLVRASFFYQIDHRFRIGKSRVETNRRGELLSGPDDGGGLHSASLTYGFSKLCQKQSRPAIVSIPVIPPPPMRPASAVHPAGYARAG